MKSYIIGGSGFIGTHLSKKLISLHHEVILIKHNESYTIKDADYIFYVASYGNHFHQKDKYKTVKANIIDLIDLLRIINDMPYKGFIHFSTSSITLPVQTAYSDTKAIAEILCKRYVRKYHKPIVSIRPSSVYGPGEAEFRFIPTIIKNLGESMPFTNGVHDWIYIDDFIRGVIKVMNHSQALMGKSIPIGTGVQTTNREVVHTLERIANKHITFIETESMKRPYDTNNWVADTTIMKSLDFKPNYTLQKGLKKTYDAFK